MTKSWQDCKNILVIRADNMGDLIMSSPAIRALKETFSSKITVLTSPMAAGIVPSIAGIDEAIIFDLPWIKSKDSTGGEVITKLIKQLKDKEFDAAVIFTVFSQNPLPAAMLAYQAGIPLRLAYCRENPYLLLTDWLPDKEPYTFIQHQVRRDLNLVSSVGAFTNDHSLRLTTVGINKSEVLSKLKKTGVDLLRQWVIFHAGVSEKKREYPAANWVEAAQILIEKKGVQILFTGARTEKLICDELAEKTGQNAFSVAGIFSLQEFVMLIEQAPVIVSVNTGAVHIAAAVSTPVVVLYARTNPQHTPWMVPNRVLEYEVDKESRSKNEVIQHLYKELYNKVADFPGADEIVTAVTQLLHEEPAIKEAALHGTLTQ